MENKSRNCKIFQGEEEKIYQDYLYELVKEHPNWSQREYAKAVNDKFETKVSENKICKDFHALNIHIASDDNGKKIYKYEPALPSDKYSVDIYHHVNLDKKLSGKLTRYMMPVDVGYERAIAEILYKHFSKRDFYFVLGLGCIQISGTADNLKELKTYIKNNSDYYDQILKNTLPH